LSEVVNVGVAELKIADNSNVLASFGLGSCVAVAMFDPLKKIGGLAHVMLPESRGKETGAEASGKFADTAVPRLVEELVKDGARKNSLRCKIVGGAQMFEIPGAHRRQEHRGGQAATRGAQDTARRRGHRRKLRAHGEVQLVERGGRGELHLPRTDAHLVGRNYSDHTAHWRV
jgi:chemotaxis receptor (MCP) glutamine deamidase CheD